MKRKIFISMATGFAGAIIGGTVLGWFAGFFGLKSLICSLIIGLFSGALPGFFAGGTIAMFAGALFGMLGYLWGQFLDVNLHYERSAAKWLMKTQPGLSAEAARRIALLQKQGATPWMLLKERMNLGEIRWIFDSALVAVLTVFMMSLIRRD